METTPEGRMRKRKNSICLSTTESTGKRERINLRRPVYLIKRRRGNLVDFLCVDVATRIGIVVTFNSISTDPSSSSDRGGNFFSRVHLSVGVALPTSDIESLMAAMLSALFRLTRRVTVIEALLFFLHARFHARLNPTSLFLYRPTFGHISP